MPRASTRKKAQNALLQGGATALTTFNPVAGLVVAGASFFTSLLTSDPPVPPSRNRGLLSPVQFKRWVFGYCRAPGFLRFENSHTFLPAESVPEEWGAAPLVAATNIRTDVNVLDHLLYFSHDELSALHGLFLDNTPIPLTPSFGPVYDAGSPLYVPLEDDDRGYRGRMGVHPYFTEETLPQINTFSYDAYTNTRYRRTGTADLNLPALYGDSTPRWREEYLDAIKVASFARVSLAGYGEGFWRNRPYPTTIDALVSGVPVYDLSQYPNHLTADRVYTNNAYSVLYFVLKEKYGKDDDELDMASLLEAYNYSDVILEVDYNQYEADRTTLANGNDAVDYSNYPAQSRRYAFDGIVTTEDTDLKRELARFNLATNGTVVPARGRLVFRCGKLYAPVSVAITDADWKRAPTRISQLPTDQQYNAVTVRYRNQTRNFEEVEERIVDEEAAQRDGHERDAPGVLVMDNCNDPTAVRRKVIAQLAKHRRIQMVEGEVIGLADGYDVGDTVPVDCTSLGLNRANFILGEVERSPNTDETKLTATREDDVYSDSFFLPPLAPVDVSAPFTETPDDIQITTTHGEDGKVLTTTVSYTNSTYVPTTEIRWRLATGVGDAIPEWTTRSVPNAETDGNEHEVAYPRTFENDTDYVFQLRNIGVTGRESAWTGDIAYNPSHDTVPPDAIEGLEVFGVLGGCAVRRIPVDRDAVPDYAYTQVTRFWTVPGGDPQTDTVTFTGSSQSWDDIVPQAHAVPIRLHIADVDTSGNTGPVEETTIDSVAVSAEGGAGYAGPLTFNHKFTYNKLWRDGRFDTRTGVGFPKGADGAYSMRVGGLDYPRYPIPLWHPTAATATAEGKEYFIAFQTTYAAPPNSASGALPGAPWARLSYPISYPENYAPAVHGTQYIIRRSSPRIGSGESYGAWQRVQGGIIQDAPVDWAYLTAMQDGTFILADGDGDGQDIRDPVSTLNAGDYMTWFKDITTYLVYELRSKPAAFRRTGSLQDLAYQFVPELSRYDTPISEAELLTTVWSVRFFSAALFRPPMLERYNYNNYAAPGETRADVGSQPGTWELRDGDGNPLPSTFSGFYAAASAVVQNVDSDGQDHTAYFESLVEDSFTTLHFQERQWYQWQVQSATVGTHSTHIVFKGPSLRAETDPNFNIPDASGFAVQWQFSQPRAGETGGRGADGEDGQGFEDRFTISATRSITDPTKLLEDTEAYDPVTPTTRNGQVWTDGASVAPTPEEPYVLKQQRTILGSPMRGALPPTMGHRWGSWSPSIYVTELGKDSPFRESIYFQNASGIVPLLPVIGAPAGGHAQIFKETTGGVFIPATDADFQGDDYVPVTRQSATRAGDPNLYGHWSDDAPDQAPANRYIYRCRRDKFGGTAFKRLWRPYEHMRLHSTLARGPREFFIYLPANVDAYLTGLTWHAASREWRNAGGVKVFGGASRTSFILSALPANSGAEVTQETPIRPGESKAVDNAEALPVALDENTTDPGPLFDILYKKGNYWVQGVWFVGRPEEYTDLRTLFSNLDLEVWCCRQTWNEEAKNYNPISIPFKCGDRFSDPKPPTTPADAVWVKTIDADGRPQWRNLNDFRGAPTGTPGVPTVPTLRNIFAREMRLEWSYPADAPATDFEIQYSTASDFSVNPLTVAVSGGTTRARVVTGLSPNTRYYMRVRSRVADRVSAYSASTNATTDRVPVMTASRITQRTVQLTWTAGSGTGLYRVENKTATGTSWRSVDTAAGVTYQVVALGPGTEYQFRVYRIRQGVKNASEPITLTTLGVAPAPPAPPVPSPVGVPVVTVTPVDNDTLRATWTAVAGAGSYTIDWDTVSTFARPTRRTTNATTFTIDGLTASTTYYVRVRKGTAAFSGTASGMTLGDGPTLSGTPTQTSVALRWSGGAVTIGDWKLEQSTDQNTWAEVTTTARTSYTVRGLTHSTTYYFRVRRDNQGLYGTLTTRTSYVAPTLTVGTKTDTTVMLSWTGGTAPGNSYTLQRRQGTSGVWASRSVTNVTRYTYTGLRPSTLYQFRVRRGIGPTSSVRQATTPATPVGPTIVTFGITSARINLRWSGGTETTGTYDVQRSLDQRTWTAVSTNTANTSASVIGLRANTRYYFRARRNDGVWGTTVSARTLGVTAPVVSTTAPTVSVGTRTTTTVALVWAQGTGTAGNYTVQYRAGTSGNYTTASTTIPGTSYTVTGLTAGTAYQFRVGQPATPYGTASASTLHTAPTVSVTATTETSVTLSATGGSRTGAYAYQYKRTIDSTWTTATSHVITGLSAGTFYNFRVNKGGGTEYGTVNATTSQSAPTLALLFATATAVNLSWTSGTGPVGRYDVQFRAAGTTRWTSAGASTSLRVFSVTPLSPDTAYEFRVRRATGPWSATLSARTAHSPPVIYADQWNASNTQVEILWNPGSVTSGSQSIRYRKEPTTSWTSATTTLSGTVGRYTFAPPDITPSTRYQIQVRRGTGPWSVARRVTVPLVEPTVRLTPISSTSLQVGITGGRIRTGRYTIQYRLTTSSQWSTATSALVSPPYNITGLSPRNPYAVRARRGSGPWSAVQTGTTFYAPLSGLTLSLRDAHIGFRNALFLQWDVRWDAPTTARTQATSGTYTVQYRTGTSTTWRTLTSTLAGSSTTYTIQGGGIRHGTTTVEVRVRRGTQSEYASRTRRYTDRFP